MDVHRAMEVGTVVPSEKELEPERNMSIEGDASNARAVPTEIREDVK